MSEPTPPPPNAVKDALRPDEVRDARFHATAFRSGYDEESVDEFLDRVANDLAARWAAVDAGFERASSLAPPRRYLDAAGVRAQTFPATKFRQGYRVEDVDQMVQRAADSLDRLDLYLRSFRFADE
jgi:DivIVA domain-containing protein